jgi:hypothetical protein
MTDKAFLFYQKTIFSFILPSSGGGAGGGAKLSETKILIQTIQKISNC